MTVSSTQTRVSYSGNGTTTAFAVPFYFLANSDLLVILRSSAGVETTQVLDTNYTVTGAGVLTGGTVTMTSAPASGVTVVISRAAPYTQTTDLLPNDRLPAESIETALDKATMLAQQLDEVSDRSIKFPVSDSTSLTTQLPTSATRAGKYLKFTSTGAVTVGDVNGWAVNVLDYGAIGNGVADDSAAFASAWSAIKLTGGTLVIPQGTYLLNSQWQIDIDTATPHNYEIIGYGATLKAGAAVTGWAVKVFGSYNNFGLKIEGLQFDHRANTTVNGCIQAMNTTNLRIVKCSVEASGTKSNWAAVQLEDLTAGNPDTGCFWTLIDGLTVRARQGSDLFVARTTATTTVTNGSNQITVGGMATGTIEVGQTVSDVSGSVTGGLDLLPTGAIITAQVSGTPGGAGVYRISANAVGSSTTDVIAFAKYNRYGVRMLGAQNATKIVNCSFASVIDAVRLDVGSPTANPGWPNGDIVHANAVRIQRNDFEGVTNAIKINTDSPATIMPTGLMANNNRIESSYSYLNIGSADTIVADAATFTGSVPAGSNVLTVTGCTGTIAAGSTIQGAGLINPSVIQPYGTGGTTGTGGNGTYQLSLSQPIAVSAVTMTVSGVRTIANHSNPPVLGPDYAVTGSADAYVVNPNYQIVYGSTSTYYGNTLNKTGGPSDYQVVVEGIGKNFAIQNLSGLSAWNGAHIVLGQYHLWTDSTGVLRSKLGAPSSDTDGAPYFNNANITSPNEGAILYYDATTSKWKNTDNLNFNDSTNSTSVVGGNFLWGNGSTIAGRLSYDANGLYVGGSTNHPIVFDPNNVERARIATDGNVVVGTAAVPTTATSAFLWITSCAGAPTGAPTAPYTNAAALVVDTTNERLYVRVGSTWKYATLT